MLRLKHSVYCSTVTFGLVFHAMPKRCKIRTRKRRKRAAKLPISFKMISRVLLSGTGEEQVLTRTELHLAADLPRNLQELISKRFGACEGFMSSICVDYLGAAISNNTVFWQLQSVKGAFCRNDSGKAYHSDVCASEEFLVAIQTLQKNAVCLDRVPRRVPGALRAYTLNTDKGGRATAGRSGLRPISLCHRLLLRYVP